MITEDTETALNEDSLTVPPVHLDRVHKEGKVIAFTVPINTKLYKTRCAGRLEKLGSLH